MAMPGWMSSCIPVTAPVSTGKKGHGDVVMREWLAHADAHNIAAVADARNKTLAGKYIDRYGFQLVAHTRDRLVVRLPEQAREDV